MQRYLVVRVFQSILTMFVVLLVVFVMARITGDPLAVYLPEEATAADYARISAQWGLDRPLHEQYLVFMGNALRGDFGTSWRWPDRSAMGVVLDRLPATFQLAGFALLFSTVLAILVGVVSAARRDTFLDHAGKVIALLGQSLPAFWLGIVLMWIFSVELGWLPSSGRGGIQHLILPAVAMGWYQVAAVMRLIRSSMLDVLDSEYVKLARIKGLRESSVVWKHALKNAAIAPLTYYGVIAGVLMTGSVVVETVFSWPGTGQLAVEAITAKDYQVVQTVIAVFAGIFIGVNLLVDVLYAYLDPRIRYGNSS